MTLSVAKSRLKGGAWKWLLTKTFTVKTFDEFKTTFSTTFTYSRTRSEKLKAMMAQTQGSRESLQDYFFDKLWLLRRTGFFG